VVKSPVTAVENRMILHRYEALKENIEDAKAKGFFNESVGLVMLGRLDYAAEIGDITLGQMEELENMVFRDCRAKYGHIMVVGNTGIPDEALEQTP
jgi:hypothetical protein